MNEILDWLQGQLEQAEKELRARVESERVWRTGSNAMWNETAKAIGHKPMSKKERLKMAEMESRIVKKCRHSVDMLKRIIAELETLPIRIGQKDNFRNLIPRSEYPNVITRVTPKK